MADKTLIDWADSTINPVIGCSHGCNYCYARRLNDRFGYVEDFSVPQFFPKALEKPYGWKKPKIIFVCSMGELFDPQVQNRWIDNVLDMIRQNSRHQFLLLTKQPHRMLWWASQIPPNCWMGITCTGKPYHMLFSDELRDKKQLFLSFEPLLARSWTESSYIKYARWVIIGSLNGPGGRQPEREWVQEILDKADKHGVPVLMKKELDWPERRFEFPPELEAIRSGR